MSANAHDGVHLSAGFLERWLPVLDDRTLRTYLALSACYDPVHRVAEAGPAAFRRAGTRLDRRNLARLARVGLIEELPGSDSMRTLLLHIDGSGTHREDRCQPTTEEALAAHRRMVEELCQVSTQDDTPELRERCFRRYPDLRREWEVWRANRKRLSPPWRLWMELSMYLVGRFEDRYGHIKRERAELFKESSAEVVRIQLEIVDHMVRDLLRRKKEIYPLSGGPDEPWVADISEEEFTRLDFVQEVTRRYRVGPHQVYLDLREAILSSGVALVELDGKQVLRNVELPTGPGVDNRTLRDALTRPKDLDRQGLEGALRERALERIGRARRAYVEAYLDLAVRILASFRSRRKLRSPAATANRLARAVNEATAFLREDDFGTGNAVRPARIGADDVLVREKRLRGKLRK